MPGRGRTTASVLTSLVVIMVMLALRRGRRRVFAPFEVGVFIIILIDALQSFSSILRLSREGHRTIFQHHQAGLVTAWMLGDGGGENVVMCRRG